MWWIFEKKMANLLGLLWYLCYYAKNDFILIKLKFYKLIRVILAWYQINIFMPKSRIQLPLLTQRLRMVKRILVIVMNKSNEIMCSNLHLFYFYLLNILLMLATTASDHKFYLLKLYCLFLQLYVFAMWSLKKQSN